MDSIEHTHNLKLPLLVPNQSGKEFTHNEALIIIDNLMHNAVYDILNTPPEEPDIGSKYIVAAIAEENFKNKENQIAIYDENGWRFIESQEGYFVWVINHSSLYVFEDKNWKILDTSDKRLRIIEPKTNEILKYNGSNFINSSSLDDLEKLSVINNIVIEDVTKTNKLKLEINEGSSNINVSDNGENWLNCISIDNSKGIVNFERDITINGAPIATGDNLVKLKENYEITTKNLLIEFTDLEYDFQHKFTMTNLISDTSSAVQIFCNLGYDDTYSVMDYCWESIVTNSNETYSYIRNKNKGSSYQLSSDKYTDSGVKSTASTNVEFYLYPSNFPERYMSCIVRTATNYSSLKFYKTVSSCLFYNSNKINKIRFYLASGNFSGGTVKHYVIK